MSARYHNHVDQVIMVASDEDEHDNVGHREQPPTYSTLPRSVESKRHNIKDSTEPTTLMRTARQERSEKKRLKRIFRSYDDNSDGFLEKREVKNLITSNPDEFADVSRALSKATLTMKSTSKMSFAQFLNLIEDHEDFEVNDFVGQLTRAVIAPRDDSGFDVKPKGFSFYIPVMMIFSAIQIVCFFQSFKASSDEVDKKTDDGHTFQNVSTDVMNHGWSLKLKVASKTEEQYRYITYQFCHLDIMHLFGNILFQLLLGIPLEFMHGSWRIAVVYLAGVFAGSIFHVNLSLMYLGGASGGVFALITAHIASVLMNWKAMRFAILHLIAFVSYIGYKAHTGYESYKANNSSISETAHFGGALAGLLIGIGMLRNFSSSPSKRIFWIFCVAVFCLTMAYGMLRVECTKVAKKNKDPSQFCNTYQHRLDEIISSLKNYAIDGYNYVKDTFVHSENSIHKGNGSVDMDDMHIEVIVNKKKST